MLKSIFKVRHVALVINIFIVLITISLVVLGAAYSFLAISEIFHFSRIGDPDFHPALDLLESIDVLVISLVFLVFAVGINVLFVRHSDEEYLKSIPKWMRVKNFAELKFLLMEAIIASLFIIFVSVFARKAENPSIDMLVLPGAILLLAISLKLLRSGEHEEE